LFLSYISEQAKEEFVDTTQTSETIANNLASAKYSYQLNIQQENRQINTQEVAFCVFSSHEE